MDETSLIFGFVSLNRNISHRMGEGFEGGISVARLKKNDGMSMMTGIFFVERLSDS